MRFDLLNPRSRIDVRAVVSWANPSGQAGVRFLDTPRQTCRQLNDWIFANLMRGLEQASPVFPLPGDPDDLILSTSPRPAIRVGLSAPRAVALPQNRTISLPWCPVRMPSNALAKLMDILILFSATLMLFCTFMAVARVLPAWPLTVLVGIGVCGFFTSLYLCMGAWLGCGTPGAQLARIAMAGIRRAASRATGPFPLKVCLNFSDFSRSSRRLCASWRSIVAPTTIAGCAAAGLADQGSGSPRCPADRSKRFPRVPSPCTACPAA